MKGFLIILGFWVGVAGITSAATLAEAQRLENFGLYSLAEELYVKMEGSEGVLGLLRTRLAQKDSDGALEALNNNRELLGGNRAALYELLALLQQNKTQEAKLAAAKIKREGLDAEETDWANLALGLLAYNDGAFDVAESYWREISFSEEALAYAMSLYPKLTDKVAESALNKKASKELQKRLKRMKADDWGIYKFYILAQARQVGAAKAAEALRGNLGKFAVGEPQLLMALLQAKESPQRKEYLFDVIKNPKSPEAVKLTALRMASGENNIALVELGEFLGQAGAALQPKMEIILAMAWQERGEADKALALLQKTNAELLECDYKAIYFSQRAGVAEKLSKASEAAESFRELLKLECLDSAAKAQAKAKLSDSLFAAGRFEEAAEAYLDYASIDNASERSRGLYQATLAFLKAGNRAKAQEVLTQVFGSYPQALLAYLLDGREKGLSVDEMIKPFQSRTMSDSERWPIEYLQIREIEAQNPQKALELVQNILENTEATLEWRVNFELKKYDLLRKLGEYDRAGQLLTEKLIEVNPDDEFLRRGIEEALATHRYDEALALAEKLSNAKPAERVYLFLNALEGISDKTKAQEYSQRLIELLDEVPSEYRTSLTLRLARLWAKVGLLQKAVTLCDNLLEKDADEATRNETEFLKCALLELEGRPEAEAGLLALSQRPDKNTRLKAFARLVNFYEARGNTEESKAIFSRELMGLVDGSETLPPETQSEVMSAGATLIKYLPEKEAARLSDWLEALQKTQTL